MHCSESLRCVDFILKIESWAYCRRVGVESRFEIGLSAIYLTLILCSVTLHGSPYRLSNTRINWDNIQYYCPIPMLYGSHPRTPCLIIPRRAQNHHQSSDNHINHPGSLLINLQPSIPSINKRHPIEPRNNHPIFPLQLITPTPFKSLVLVPEITMPRETQERSRLKDNFRFMGE